MPTKIVILLLSLGAVALLTIMGCNNTTGKAQANTAIILPQKSTFIRMQLGGTLEYSHSTHGSVGYSYRTEYNKSGFKMEYSVEYDNPDAIASGMCGGDSAMETCVFTALKKGTFTIKIIHEFRGTVEKVLTYVVLVN